MFIANIDWTSDEAIFLVVSVLVTLAFVVALSYASPGRRSRRRVDKRGGQGRGELID